MSVVAPCITTETIEQYQAMLQKVAPFAKRVHIDISDGEFAPKFLLPENQLSWPATWEVDIHAMVMRPQEHLAALINLKPRLIIFHVETGINMMPIFEQIKQAGIKAGAALLKPTVPSTISDIIKAVDHVMIFSGDLGFYGGKASLMQLEKVRLVKAINPSVEIGWDGGVNVDNAYTLTQGGVDVLNSGGFIANADDPALAYNELMKEISKHGVI